MNYYFNNPFFWAFISMFALVGAHGPVFHQHGQGSGVSGHDQAGQGPGETHSGQEEIELFHGKFRISG